MPLLNLPKTQTSLVESLSAPSCSVNFLSATPRMAGNKPHLRGMDRHQALPQGQTAHLQGGSVSTDNSFKFLEPSECREWSEMRTVREVTSFRQFVGDLT